MMANKGSEKYVNLWSESPQNDGSGLRLATAKTNIQDTLTTSTNTILVSHERLRQAAYADGQGDHRNPFKLCLGHHHPCAWSCDEIAGPKGSKSNSK